LPEPSERTGWDAFSIERNRVAEITAMMRIVAALKGRVAFARGWTAFEGRR
jgi:hypothetical protein